MKPDDIPLYIDLYWLTRALINLGYIGEKRP